MIKKLMQHRFLFEELVKRDFKTKYKRTVLGIGWSLLAPLLLFQPVTHVGTWYHKLEATPQTDIHRYHGRGS